MKGYDVFYEDVDIVGERNCLVCGSKCHVERNRIGPTSWMGAMGKIDRAYDYFYCPNMDHAWHQQALELIQAIEKMPSKRVSALMQQDLSELLRDHGCNFE